MKIAIILLILEALLILSTSSVKAQGFDQPGGCFGCYVQPIEQPGFRANDYMGVPYQYQQINTNTQPTGQDYQRMREQSMDNLRRIRQ